MNEDAAEVSIPLTVDTDQAAANIEQLQSVAETLDSTLERLQQRAITAFNSIGMTLSGQPYRAETYGQVETFSKAVGAEDLWAQSPRLGRAMAEVDVQRDQIAARVSQFATTNTTAASTLTGPALYNAFQASTPPPAPPATLQAPQGTGTPVGGAAAAAALPPIGSGAPLPASVSSPTPPPPVTTAVDPLARLRADAEALDPQLQTRETHATRLFNQLALTSGDGQPVKAARYSEVRQHLSALTPEETWEMSPALGQSLVNTEQRRAAIGARVEQFAATPAFEAATAPAGATTSPATTATPPPAATTATPPPAATTATPPPAATTATPPPAATPAPAPAAVFDAFSSWLDAQPARASSSSVPAIPNAFGTTAAPLPLGLGLGGGTTPQDTDRTATTFADKISSALTHSGGSVASGLARGAFDAAGMGAAGDVVSGLARPVAGALGELFAPVAGALAAVGVGLGVNQQSSHYFGEEQTLAGGVGSRGGATPSSELTVAQQTGWNYMFHEKQSVAAARQLGDAGVDSSQLGGTLSASMALARVGGMDLGTTTQLSGQYARAGFSGSQISDTYAEMDQASKLTGVSLSRITAAIKELNQTAGLGAIGVSSFAATQAFAGPELHVEQALAPAIGAQGAEAIHMQAMLQLSPQAFQNAQRRPDLLWDAYAGVAKRYDRGTYGTDVAEEALKSAGLDLSALKGPDAANVVQRLVSQGPKAAEDYYTSLQAKEKAKPETGATFDQKGTDAANRQTAAIEKGTIAVEQWTAAMLRSSDSVAGSNAPLRRQAHDNGAAQRLHEQQLVDEARTHKPKDLLAMVQAHPNDPNALLRYEAVTNAQAYANDPNISNPADASGSKEFGPLSEARLGQVRQHGTWVGGGRSTGSRLDPATFIALEDATRRTGVPLPILMSQMRQENTVNGRIDSQAVNASDGGTGLGQWTPGKHNENLPTIEKYLGMASQTLGLGPVTASNWRQAALNPRVAALGTAYYDAAAYGSKAAEHDWSKALSQVQGGPNGWNDTGHPGHGRDYGTSVVAGAEQVQHQLGITVTVKDTTGRHVGQAQTKHTVSHPVKHARKAVAAASYGPEDRTPPASPPRFHPFG